MMLKSKCVNKETDITTRKFVDQQLYLMISIL